MLNLFVKPAAAGAIVPDPDNGYRPLPAEGAWKPKSQYWLRRIAGGDVVDLTSKQTVAQQAAAKQPAAASPPRASIVAPEPEKVQPAPKNATPTSNAS